MNASNKQEAIYWLLATLQQLTGVTIRDLKPKRSIDFERVQKYLKWATDYSDKAAIENYENNFNKAVSK